MRKSRPGEKVKKSILAMLNVLFNPQSFPSCSSKYICSKYLDT